jgi:hypothetical protein
MKSLAPGLTSIYQKSIDTGTMPRDWLNVNVSCIFKKGNKHVTENYRPVSLQELVVWHILLIFCFYEFWLSLCKIVRSSVILLLPLCYLVLKLWRGLYS